MPFVQTSIHLLVDFHIHDDGTVKLGALDPVTRSTFLVRCGDALYGTRPADFVELHASTTFRPFLALEAATNLPSSSDVHQALFNAVVHYNEAAFGLTFDPDFGSAMGGMQSGAALPPYACVQKVWVVDHWETRYNYDLAPLADVPSQVLPDGRTLKAGYRVALFQG